MKQAKLIIYMADAAQSVSEIEEQLRGLEQLAIPYLILVNKADLITEVQRKAFADLNVVFISAKEKQGIEALKTTLLEQVNLHHINTSETLVTNIRHVEALKQTEHALQRVLDNVDNPVTSDFLAMDIKQALHYLGEITGTVTTDDLLENIFTKFCIGK
ncbi:tRNA modification GTPase MnmE [compost metagenome]